MLSVSFLFFCFAFINSCYFSFFLRICCVPCLLLFFVFLAVFVVSNIIYVSLFNLCAGDSTFWDVSTQLSRFVFNCSMCVWHSEQLEVAHVAYGSLRAAGERHWLSAACFRCRQGLHTAHRTHTNTHTNTHTHTNANANASTNAHPNANAKANANANPIANANAPHHTGPDHTRPHQTHQTTPQHIPYTSIHIHTPRTQHPNTTHPTPHTTHRAKFYCRPGWMESAKPLSQGPHWADLFTWGCYDDNDL